MKKLFP
jgi:hypothetical protein